MESAGLFCDMAVYSAAHSSGSTDVVFLYYMFEIFEI